MSTALLGAFGIVYLLVAWVLGPTLWASVVVLTAVAWFYLYWLAVRMTKGAVGHPVLIVLGVLVTAALLLSVGRSQRALEFVSGFLGLTGVLMVGWSVCRIGIRAMLEHRAIASSALARNLAVPIQAGRAGLRPLGKPNIYLIVLDEYANSAVLREQFGFDNREFEDSLRRLGFVIPRLVRSNYVRTTFSLPSLLNFAHLTQLTAELGPNSTDPTLADYLLENNRTVRFLQSQGYRFAFFPSEWWRATAHNRHADWEFRTSDKFSLWGALARTELRRSLWGRSLLHGMGSPYVVDAEYIKQTFQGLHRVNNERGPTFVFAHIILPHIPYVFDATCRPIETHDEPPRYVGQLRCANAMVIDLVTALIRGSARPPVILLQGDHGTAMLGYNLALDARHVSAAQARERFGAFGAYYLPGGGERALGDTLTLVNVFPKLLNYYFATRLPLAPDDLYMSLEAAPLDFTKVDPRSLN